MFLSHRSIKVFLFAAFASAPLLLTSARKFKKSSKSSKSDRRFPFVFSVLSITDLFDISLSTGFNVLTQQPSLVGGQLIIPPKLFLPEDDIDPSNIDFGKSIGFSTVACVITEVNDEGEILKNSCSYTSCVGSNGDCYFGTSGGSVVGGTITTGILTGGTGSFEGIVGTFTIPNCGANFADPNLQPGEEFLILDVVIKITGLLVVPADPLSLYRK